MNDLDAVAARITTQDGRVVEDVVEDGIAALTWRGPLATHDALVELLGPDGRVLRSAPMHPHRPRS